MLEPLGPFDGRVGATIAFRGESYFITTNCDYIPAPTVTTQVFIRDDMRYGVDDFTLWPQPFSPKFPHLAVVPKRELRPDLALLWWQPQPTDFIFGASITRGLGRLRNQTLSLLIGHFNSIVGRYKEYAKSLPDGRAPGLFDEVVQAIVLGLERLQTLPTTFDKMRFSLACVQKNILELVALLDYMEIYQPRMKKYGVRSQPVGEKLDVAGLPFWFLRPFHTFDNENILAVVPVTAPPADLTAPPAPEHLPVYSGTSVDAKIKLGQVPLLLQHPHHPLLSLRNLTQAAVAEALRAINHHRNSGSGSTSRAPGSVTRGRGGAGSTSSAPVNSGRDKFKPLVADEMPGYIATWSDALARVNRHAPVNAASEDRFYVFPEPALLASAQSQDRRNMMVYHWMLLRDVIMYRITERVGSVCLSSQEWRDMLEGRIIRAENRRNRRTSHSRLLADIVERLISDSGFDPTAFPPASNTIPHYDIHVVKQIIWEVAEVNFRFELLSLDRRASRKRRDGLVLMCVAGGQVFNVPLLMAKRGLAAPEVAERHRYHLRLARLMMDWRVASARPLAIEVALVRDRANWVWTEDQMHELGTAVASYYTQSFFRALWTSCGTPDDSGP
ncbi:hypothetical protein B0H14DRAFT_3526013 [Mycena olivaceomarginata]|nr:hypothetical protein B0H14DRAFT_3526013 [Mycena olivaceomarginata]